MGNFANENTPKTMTAKKQRLVIIGRLTAPSYILILLYLLFDDFNFSTVGKFRLSCHNDHVAVVHTADDFVGVADLASQFHFVVTYLSVLIYIDVAVAGTDLLHDSHVGNDYVLLIAEVDGGTCKHTRTHFLLGVADGDFDGERVCSRVD